MNIAKNYLGPAMYYYRIDVGDKLKVTKLLSTQGGPELRDYVNKIVTVTRTDYCGDPDDEDVEYCKTCPHGRRSIYVELEDGGREVCSCYLDLVTPYGRKIL